MTAPTEADRWTGIVSKLRLRRTSLGLSQMELDERIGLTRGHVDKFEQGKRRPTAFVLACWCEALGLMLDVRDPRETHAVSSTYNNGRTAAAKPTAGAKAPAQQVRQQSDHARGRGLRLEAGAQAMARA